MTWRGVRLGAASVGLATVLIGGVVTHAEDAPAYVNGFCLSVTAGSGNVEAFRERLQAFDARPAPAAEAEAAKPEGAEVAGQLFRFSMPGAPAAFVDNRRGACALVFEGENLPTTARQELTRGRLPVGPDGALIGWRKVTQSFVGRARPAKYFLQLGERELFGVCAEVQTDLRRRDQAVVSLLQLYSCRIGSDERLENG